MACDEREAALAQEKPATTTLSLKEVDSVDDECKATAEPEAGTEGTSAIAAAAKPGPSIDQTYTTALLRGRHPRSFRNERGIYQYVKDSNERANMGQKGHAQSHNRPVLADPNSLVGQSSGGGGGDLDRSLRSPTTVGVQLSASSSSPQDGNVHERNNNNNDEDENQRGHQLPSSPSSRSPRPATATTPSASLETGGSRQHVATGTGEQPLQQGNSQSSSREGSVLYAGGARTRSAGGGGGRRHRHPQPAAPGGGGGAEQLQQSVATCDPNTAGKDGGGGGGSRRRPRRGLLASRGAFPSKMPPAPLGRGGSSLLGGYVIQQGLPFRGGGGEASGLFPGADGLTGGGRGTSGHGGQQASRGRAGDRPMSMHQKFNVMVGIQRESSSREEEGTQVLDSLNHDPSLRLHYGLHVTFQAVQGENGYFMSLDMETGGVSMIPLHELQNNNQVTFKMIDLEDPESYRSIFYGKPVWLQIVPGPGEPTWREGSVLGARVHGPGMLPTVVIDPNDAAAASSMAHQTAHSRPGTSESTPGPGTRRPVLTHGASSGRGNAGGNARESPGGGGGWAESCFLPGGGGGGGGGGEVVGAGGVSSAVGGGNTDANRPVGVPYPFKAAGSKHGGAGGTANETLLRAMNKSAIVNCRWTIRPVRSDGQSLLGKDGKEVSNLDYVYLEQDFFYMTRVSENASVVLKALSHNNRSAGSNGGGGGGGSAGGKRGTAQKHHPVGRRGVFKLQVADADELRPGEERSAALMRKAKRGLKRSEARRSGHRTYVHKQRPQDHLTSGAAFPREIRVRTTHFVSESASRAISSASHSPRRRGGADGGGGGPGGGEKGGVVGYSRGGVSLGGSWDGFGDGGGGSAWLNAGSWGTDVLQAMTDFARAGAESGVTASHARVLREWKQRWGPLGTMWSQADDQSSRETTGDSSDSNGEGEDGGDEGHGWSLVSPMCSRCRYLTAHPLTPPPPAGTIGTCSSRSLSSSASTATAMDEADVTLGRYCLCTVNREIQREVLQGDASGGHARAATTEPGAALSIGTEAGHEASVSSPTAEGGAPSASPAASRMSTPAGGAASGLNASEMSGELALEGAGRPAGGASERNTSLGGGGGLSRMPSSNGLVLAAGGFAAGGAGGTIGGLKRARDRRADRRKKKDPFEALEERLLDGFSLESITKRLQQQDETLQKGVRHVERMESRRHEPGRRSNEEHQRYLMVQKKRFEAVVSDSIAESIAGSSLSAGDERGSEDAPTVDDAPGADVVAVARKEVARDENAD
ncbi:unnamed protein product [Ectocarpus sp. 4 AP-2014]